MYLLKPDYIACSLQDITPVLLQQNGIRGIILDLDNTIIAWDSAVMQPDIIDWISVLKRQQYHICLLSNNMTERVSQIAELLQVPFIPKACKPLKRGFRQALAAMELEASEVAVVGDQLFTDVLGGNRLHLFTIWVSPLADREFIGTRVTRQVERLAVKFLIMRGILPAHDLKKRRIE